MNKLLHFSLMMLLAVFGMSNAMADDVDIVFTFNTDDGITELGIPKPEASAGSNLADLNPANQITKDAVTITNVTGQGKTETRVWNSNGTLDLRIYATSSLTFTTSSQKIKKIVLKGGTVGGFTASAGEFSGGTWSGLETEVTLTATGTEKINTITVTLGTEAGGGSEVPEFTTVANIAAFKALNSGDEAKLTLSDAKVLFAKNKDIYVKDNTGAIDFYDTGLSALKTGCTVSGTVIGKYSPYNNLPEFVKNDYTSSNDLTITEGTVDATAITIANVSDDYICDLIKLTNVKVVQKTEGDKTNNYATDGSNEVLFYNKFSVSNALNAIDPEKPDNTYDIEGILVYSGGNLAIGVTKAVVVNQETGESYTFVGNGTETNPYTVEDVRHIDSEAYPADNVWVKGIIIGSAKSATALHAGTEEDADVASNIAIADEASATKFIPVELANNTAFRTKLNVKENPSNVGKDVLLYGKVTSYFQTTGVKNLVEAEFDGETITGNKAKAELSWGVESKDVSLDADDNIFPQLSNPHELSVTYSSSKEEVATIDENGVITLKAVGQTKISAIFAGNDTYEASTVSYTLNVTSGESVDPEAAIEGGTLESPMTAEQALAYITEFPDGFTTSNQYYVSGTVSEVTEINTEKGNATFKIGDLVVFRVKGLQGNSITDENYLKEGDEVVVLAKLQKYVKNETTTPELSSGYIYELNGKTTDSDEPVEFEGDGTKENPYTVADLKQMKESDYPTDAVWVIGVIVGSAKSATELNEEDKNSNIAIADDVTRSDVVEFVPVELKNNTDFRAKLNVVDNPGNIGMGVMLCGKIEKYFGTTGIKSLVEAEIGGETITGIQNLTIGNDADAPIYNLKGERVDQNYRGVVIQNGHKKVQK